MSINTTPRTWVAGEVVTAALFNTEVRDFNTGLQAGWTSYTPTWTGTTTNPVAASHTLTGSYCRIGKTLIGNVRITLGSTNFGSGTYYFGLPFAAAGGFIGSAQITGIIYDASATTKLSRGGFLQSSTEMVLTGEAGGLIGPTVPITLAVGDVIAISYTLQLA